MPIQQIGKMRLYNGADFNVKIKFVYFDEKGSRHLSEASGAFEKYQSKTEDPGNEKYKVPDGSLFYLFADGQGGGDRQAWRAFIYKRGSPIVAKYKITRTLVNSHLYLEDIARD